MVSGWLPQGHGFDGLKPNGYGVRCGRVRGSAGHYFDSCPCLPIKRQSVFFIIIWLLCCPGFDWLSPNGLGWGLAR